MKEICLYIVLSNLDMNKKQKKKIMHQYCTNWLLSLDITLGGHISVSRTEES